MSERQKAIDFAIRLYSYIAAMFGGQIAEKVEPIILKHFEDFFLEAMANDSKISELEAQLKQAESKLQTATETLEFYAKQDNWQQYRFPRPSEVMLDVESACFAPGKRAREALQKIKGSK